MSDNYSSSFWLPPFSLPQEARYRVAELIGEDYVDRVEKACQVYLGFSENQADKPSLGEINKKLREIHKCASQIFSILKDDAVKGKLSLLIKDQYPDSREFLERNGSCLRSLGNDMSLLIDATSNVPKAKPGRIEGSSNEAARHFVYSLYLCCRDAGHPPTRVNPPGDLPQGVLHKLIRIVAEPLKLGGVTFPGIADEVIKFMKNN